MTLTEFLLARIAEDEAVAREAGLQPDRPYESPLYVVDDSYRFDQVGIYPDRVLAECESKRRILAEAFEVAATIDGEWGCCHDAEVADKFLALLALPYADHPEYDEAWRP